ncbi:MAG: hypothetical protein HUJ21_18910 [Cyclobacterium sp.]|nr:hypothetical protein [Cyclobacterium sp.]
MIDVMNYRWLLLSGLGLLLMGEIAKTTPEPGQKNQSTRTEENLENGKTSPAGLDQNFRLVSREEVLKEGFAGTKRKMVAEEILPKKVGSASQERARTVVIEIVPELMKYDTDTFTVKTGEKIMLELDNLDGMQHNLLILKPGSLEKVGKAADAMLRDPRASEKHYVPEIPEVLFATEMLGPGELYTLNFTVPDTPGDYPFVCTFPGHWRMMNGIMRVEAGN